MSIMMLVRLAPEYICGVFEMQMKRVQLLSRFCIALLSTCSWQSSEQRREEIEALLGVVKSYDRLFAVHHRCEGDEVVAALPVRNADDAVAVFTETGLAKKMLPKEVVVQKRGGRGLICYKPTDASGSIVGAAMVSDEDNILIVGNKSSICVAATDIPALGRTGIGNQMIKSGRVSTISKV